MKTGIINFALAFLIAVTSLSAQSDYEKVQNVKNDVAQIRAAIKGAASLAELETLQETINSIREKYQDDKDLLDKSLYPDDYTSIFAKLENELELRKADFSQIENLQIEVTGLKSELQELNDNNTLLLSKIKEYQSIGGKDAQSLVQLKRLVADLRKSLAQRDELVRNLVDSLLSDFVKHPMTLNSAEKQQIYESVETGNLFYNIEKTIRDNMEFIKATQLGADDLGEVKEDQVQFYNMWKKMGPGLADIYMDKGEKAGEVAYITNLFAQWNQRIDREIWGNIYQVLRNNKVEVKAFTDGDEFTNNMLEFINTSKASSTQEFYETFEDSIWTEQLKAGWLPILIDNEMLTVDQREQIQTVIDEWGMLYKEKTPVYWYIAIGIIIIVFLLIFIPKWKNKNKPLAQQ